MLKRDKQKYLLLDTYALIPDALSRVTSALAPELVKLSRSWVLPDGSTNYFSPDSEEDRAYLARDVRGLLVAVRRFKDTIFQLFDINTGYTAGGTAMRAWRRSLPEDVTYWRQHPRVDALGREAYKGGLIIFTRCDRQYDMVHVDVNAMYAWAMAQGVPVGRGILTDHEVVGYPGIYRVELRVPASERYPFIGSNGVPSLKPTGVFSATVTSVELVEARRRGYSYVVQDGCYFEEMGHPFEQFLSQAQALEMDHKGDALGYAVKIMRNSLYGKFGSQPASMNYVLTESPREGLTPVVDPHTGALVPCLYAQAATIDEPYLQPVWAAFITAHARVRLAQLARRLEGVYGDTDSVVFPARNLESALADGSLRISRTYGDVKIEHHYRWFQCGGPKNYQAQTDSGELIDRAKGIPRSLLNQDSIPVRVDGVAQNMPAMEAHALALAGHAVEVVYLSMNSTLASLKRGRAKTEDRRRSYSRLERSEQWRADGTGAVYPVQLSGETRAVANTG
ncbi:MAG: hypothetical protein IVW55_12275 [Chloroflexi bacterium]|nr:hypothetical protein [Chloroflexota bacterium]